MYNVHFMAIWNMSYHDKQINFNEFGIKFAFSGLWSDTKNNSVHCTVSAYEIPLNFACVSCEFFFSRAKSS